MREHIQKRHESEALISRLDYLAAKGTAEAVDLLKRLCLIVKAVYEAKKDEAYNLKKHDLYRHAFNYLKGEYIIQPIQQTTTTTSTYTIPHVNTIPQVRPVTTTTTEIPTVTPAVQTVTDAKPRGVVINPVVNKEIIPTDTHYTQNIPDIHTSVTDGKIRRVKSGELEGGNIDLDLMDRATPVFTTETGKINTLPNLVTEKSTPSISEISNIAIPSQTIPVSDDINNNFTNEPITETPTPIIEDYTTKVPQKFTRRASSIFDDISKEDLILAREREMSPEITSRVHLNNIEPKEKSEEEQEIEYLPDKFEEPLLEEKVEKEQKAIERKTSKLPEDFHAEPNIQVIKKEPEERRKAVRVQKPPQIIQQPQAVVQPKKYNIHTDQNSIIKLPPECKLCKVK